MKTSNRTENLESLFAKEELERLKGIRVVERPRKVKEIGRGGYGKVYLFETDGKSLAGKKPIINLFNKTKEEERQLKEVSRDSIVKT